MTKRKKKAFELKKAEQEEVQPEPSAQDVVNADAEAKPQPAADASEPRVVGTLSLALVEVSTRRGTKRGPVVTGYLGLDRLDVAKMCQIVADRLLKGPFRMPAAELVPGPAAVVAQPAPPAAPAAPKAEPEPEDPGTPAT